MRLRYSQERTLAEDRLEEELSASKEHYDLLFNNVNDLIIIHDLEGRILEANRIASQTFGYSQEELAHMSISDLQRSGRDEFPDYLGTLLSTRHLVTKPIEHVTKDGRAIWLEIRAGMAEYDGKNVVYSICRDMTDRKKEEDMHTQSEAKFRAAFDMAATGMIMETIDGIIISVNEAFCKMLGYNEEELVGKKTAEITHPDEIEETLEVIRNVIAGYGSEHLEKRYMGKDGRMIWAYTNFSCVRTADGIAPYILAQIQDITKRKEIEQAFVESEEKYKELVESANCIILKFDAKGRITSFNEFAQNYFGYTEGEIIGKSIFDTIVPRTESTGKNLENMVMDIVEQEKKYSRNLNENIKKNGERVWIHWTNRPIKDKFGKGREILSVGLDFTQQIRMEKELADSESKFRAIFDQASIGLVLSSLEGTLIDLNDAFCKMTGYSREELIGKKTLDITYPEDMEATKQRFMDFNMPGHKTLHYEKRYVKKDGEVLWGLLGTTKIINPEGKPPYLLSQIQDITERKKVEKALQESEENYRTIIEASPEPMIIYQGGKIVFDNAAAVKFYGSSTLGRSLTDIIYPEDIETVLKNGAQFVLGDFDSSLSPQVAKKRIDELFSPENNDRIWKNFKTIRQPLSEGSKFSTPMVIRTFLHDNSIAWIEVVGALINWKDSIAALMIWHDITERKKMEDTIKQHSEHLEELVQERTEQLRRSERLATIGQTAAAVGHDLKGPLQTFVNAIYLVNRTLASQNMAESDRGKIDSYFAMMNSQIKYMNNLILDLQHMAKEIMPDRTEMKIKDILNDVVSSLEITPNIKLNFKAEDIAFIDPFLMKRAIINLSNNAIQAMPNGGTLTIETSSQGDVTTIKVGDTGVGIPKENMSKLFQALFTTKSRGTGLGLVIVKRIVEAHEGAIEVESVQGQGTVFKITLPKKAAK